MKFKEKHFIIGAIAILLVLGVFLFIPKPQTMVSAYSASCSQTTDYIECSAFQDGAPTCGLAEVPNSFYFSGFTLAGATSILPYDLRPIFAGTNPYDTCDMSATFTNKLDLKTIQKSWTGAPCGWGCCISQEKINVPTYCGGGMSTNANIKWYNKYVEVVEVGVQPNMTAGEEVGAGAGAEVQATNIYLAYGIVIALIVAMGIMLWFMFKKRR